MKNFAHNVIRVKKGKSSNFQTYKFIVILNKKKQSSEKIKKKIGYYYSGLNSRICLNCYDLATYLNKGSIMNISMKKYIYGYSYFR
jgi:hypothetical protein